MKDKIRVLIADDHKMFLQGLGSILDEVENIEVVQTVTNGEEAIRQLQSVEVDVVLTDISMPEMDGVQLSQRVKKNYPDTKVLILSTHNDPATIHRLISAEVDGYLLKNAEKEELIRAITTVSTGERYFADEVRDRYTHSLFSQAPQKQVGLELSKREKEILALIIEEYTAQEIAEALFISQHTVNTHRKNLLSKLGVKNTAGLVKKTLLKGLLQ